MGSHYVEKPHYEKQEQIMCAVEGKMSIVMIPHVNRQEVHAAEMEDSMYWEPEETAAAQINGSPVNFFVPNKLKYLHFNGSTRNKVDLQKSDCVFIPAYYYYQIQGFGQLKATRKSWIDGKETTLTSDFPEMREKLDVQMELDEVYLDNVMSIGVSMKF